MILLVAGCTSIPADFSAKMSERSELYASVKKGMTRSELVALLGPAVRDEGGKSVWEISYDQKNFERLVAEFDASDHVSSLQRGHSRQSDGPMHFSRSYEIIK